jgi:Predicted transcription regulator containing HTH domain
MEDVSRSLRKIDPIRYRRLLARTMPIVIETEEENARMLAAVEKLMEKGEALSLEEEKILKLLVRLIEDFEQRYYHPKEAEPLEILHHLMEARGIKQTHLWEVFGSKGIASEVLNGKRGMSKTHARALANYFHVPADLFL